MTEPASITFEDPPVSGIVVPLPTVEEVAAFLRWEAAAAPRISPHLSVVTSFVRGYTRGRGFATIDGEPHCAEAVRATIITATARSVTNPQQRVRHEKDGESEMPAVFAGLTVMEQLSLNEYRRRTA